MINHLGEVGSKVIIIKHYKKKTTGICGILNHGDGMSALINVANAISLLCLGVAPCSMLR